MKRSGFSRPAPKPVKTIEYQPCPRAVAVARADAPARISVPVPKEAAVRDEDYRRLIAALPCAWCGIQGHSVCAHANEGKGMGIKASDASAFPLCGPRPLNNGCHFLLDQSGGLTKEHRRELEALWGNKTRMNLREAARHDKDVMAVVQRTIGL